MSFTSEKFNLHKFAEHFTLFANYFSIMPSGYYQTWVIILARITI